MNYNLKIYWVCLVLFWNDVDSCNEFILTYSSVLLISMENHMISFTWSVHNTALKLLIEWNHGEMKFILEGWFHDRFFRKKAFIYGMEMLPEITLIGKYWTVISIMTLYSFSCILGTLAILNDFCFSCGFKLYLICLFQYRFDRQGGGWLRTCIWVPVETFWC